jgi:hypothetical protein
MMRWFFVGLLYLLGTVAYIKMYSRY